MDYKELGARMIIEDIKLHQLEVLDTLLVKLLEDIKLMKSISLEILKEIQADKVLEIIRVIDDIIEAAEDFRLLGRASYSTASIAELTDKVGTLLGTIQLKLVRYMRKYTFDGALEAKLTNLYNKSMICANMTHAIYIVSRGVPL